MAKKDNRSVSALAAAAKLFERKPDASTEEFRDVCERADKATIAKLDNRSFNARYVLPFRRSAAAKRGTTTPSRRATKAGPRHDGKLGTQEKIARMIRERDRQIIMAASDPRKAYEVAAELQDFAAKCVSVLSS